MKILLALTEAMVARPLAAHLEREGQVVETEPSGGDVMQLLDHGAFDALVVDPTLPDDGGLALIRTVRARGHTLPVVVVSRFDDVRHKCLCFDSGADDHMTLPFRSEELHARLKSIARRAAGHLTAELSFGPIRLDTTRRSVTVAGHPVRLSRFEFLILEALMLRLHRPVSRDALFGLTHADSCEADSRTVEVTMMRLRRKLAAADPSVAIETVRTVGYRLVHGAATAEAVA